MPLSMINSIRSAETDAARALAAAKREAAAAVEAAEREARATLERVRKEARVEERRLIAEAEAAAHRTLETLAEQNLAQVAALRDQAQGRMASAVDRIVSAILTGAP